MAGRVSSPVVVGRASELATLIGVLDRAQAGATVAVLLAGEAGVGKTRTSAEVERTASDRGFRVLRGSCVNLGGSSLPYGPIVELLRDVADTLDPAELADVAGAGATDLARLVPQFAPGQPVDALSSDWIQARLFDAVLGLLERLAERSPILVVIEDLHWSDPATREAVAFLVRALRDVPVVLLGTYRSDELHRRHPLLPWLADLERTGRVDRVQLERLDRAEIGALVSAIVGGRPEPGIVDDVYDRSDGNPFFAEELVAAHGDRPGQRVRSTLREILLARVAVLPDTAGAVLGVAAVAGRRVEHDLLATVAGLPQAELMDGLRAAVSRHLLVVEGDGSDDRYAFRHALLQEVVYDELLPGERRQLHRAFAEALDARDTDRRGSDAGYWAELAHHWAAAREDRRAFEASMRAGAAACESFAFGAALEADERALELWDDIADPEAVAGFDRVELARRAARSAYLAANYRRAVTLLKDAIACAGPGTDPARSGILHEELGRALYVLGDPGASLDAYRQAVDIIPAEPPSAERARVMSGYGQILMLLARYHEAIEYCEGAIAVARAVGARTQEGHALNTLGLSKAATGRSGSGIADLREALAIAREVRDADDIGRAYVNLAEALDEVGETVEAVEVTEEGLRQADELGIGHSYGHYLRLNGVMFAYELGRWEDGRRLLEATTMWSPVGPGPEIYRLANSLPLLVSEGSFEAADAEMPRALELVDDQRGAQFTGPLIAAAAERELWRHAPRVALEHVAHGLDRLGDTEDRFNVAMLTQVGARAAGDLAEEGRARRDPDAIAEARTAYDALRERLAQLPTPEVPNAPGGPASTCRSMLLAEAGRIDGRSDPAIWAAVTSDLLAEPRPYLAAYAGWRTAEAALGAGDRGAATSALRDAHALALELGARPLEASLVALARRARIELADAALGSDPATTERPGDEAAALERLGLTPRELEVLALVADGRTNRQIADLLFISESTAGVHVSNILGKLDVSSRVEAAGVAFRLGLPPAELEAPTAG